jgi:hypothetical protein
MMHDNCRQDKLACARFARTGDEPVRHEAADEGKRRPRAAARGLLVVVETMVGRRGHVRRRNRADLFLENHKSQTGVRSSLDAATGIG